MHILNGCRTYRRVCFLPEDTGSLYALVKLIWCRVGGTIEGQQWSLDDYVNTWFCSFKVRMSSACQGIVIAIIICILDSTIQCHCNGSIDYE